jgi:hypothetical protein
MQKSSTRASSALSVTESARLRTICGGTVIVIEIVEREVGPTALAGALIKAAPKTSMTAAWRTIDRFMAISSARHGTAVARRGFTQH